MVIRAVVLLCHNIIRSIEPEKRSLLSNKGQHIAKSSELKFIIIVIRETKQFNSLPSLSPLEQQVSNNGVLFQSRSTLSEI